MKASDIPSKFPIPFASAAGVGYIRTIPEASQIGIQDGAASLTDGFPPVNFLPVGAGGTPPFGQDFNGLLKQITQWAQWQAAGGWVQYDGGFATSIGGYPKGAIVASTTLGRHWFNTVDDNLTDPDGGSPVGWVSYPPKGVAAFYGTAGANTWTVPAGVYSVTVERWGGGGGGSAGNSVQAGSGGGAGEYGCDVLAVTPGATISYNIGAGGAAGASNGAAGSPGGDTTVTGLATVHGGAGAGNLATPGRGGYGSTAAEHIEGGAGNGSTTGLESGDIGCGGAAPRGGLGGTGGQNATSPGGGGAGGLGVSPNGAAGGPGYPGGIRFTW